MTFEKALKLLARNYLGTRVRGQLVEGVEIAGDVMPDHTPRYFVTVLLFENPVTGSPEQKLLQRLFSDIPRSASVLCNTWREVVAVVRRKSEAVWYLDDEQRPTQVSEEA